MSNGMLVLASKDVGAALVSYLLQEKAPIIRVIAGTACDTRIIDECARSQVPCEIYDSHTQERLVQERARFRWMLNFWSPYILKRAFLSLADHRLNIHPSLVPHCQGSDSTAWCIRKQLPAGVSLIEMDEQVDIGMVYAQREVDRPFPIRGKELHVRVQQAAIRLFMDSWSGIESGVIQPKPQTGPLTRHLRKQTNQDRVVSLDSAPAWKECIDWMLAHDFFPGTTAEVDYQGRRYRVTLNLEEVSTVVPKPQEQAA